MYCSVLVHKKYIAWGFERNVSWVRKGHVTGSVCKVRVQERRKMSVRKVRGYVALAFVI